MEPILTGTDSGLQPDSNLGVAKPGVVYAYNARPEAGAGSDYLWSNESANELAFVLPAGYTLIQSLLLLELNKSLLFLTNGTTSVIGFASHTFIPEPYTNNSEVTLDGVASSPLTVLLPPVGLYQELLHSNCLGFSISNELSVRYQFQGQDVYLYLADGNNPDRIIRFTVDAYNNLSLHIDSRVITGEDDCKAPVYGPDLDCSRCRLDALFDSLKLQAVSLQSGGVWEAGGLQFRAAYSTSLGERLTEFTAGTGLVSIWDGALQTASGQPTGKSVTLSLQASSAHYTHVVIGVLQVIGNQTKAFVLAPYPVTAATIVLRGNEPRLPASVSDLLEARTHYNNSKGLATTQDRLLRWGLTEKAVPNLQKYLLNIPIGWQTIQLPEGAYKDGIVSEKFTGFARDEVVPLGIVFEYFDGDEMGVFHLPGRVATDSDRVIVDSASSDTLGQVNKSKTGPVQSWEIYSTATKDSQLNIPYTDPDNPGIWESGTMGYWESSEVYPNRSDVWGDLCGKPIRHHKLPDSFVTHIHDGYSFDGTLKPLSKNTGYIYPLGFRIQPFYIKQALDRAVADRVIAADQLVRYRIVRGDRTGQASVLARGLLYNINQYDHEGKTIYFPNYPFNDLRDDRSISGDKNTYKNYQFPAAPLAFGKSSRYTFHSPDSSFVTYGKGDYLKLETEEFGYSEGQYSEARQEAKQQLPTGNLRGSTFTAAISDHSISSAGPTDPLGLLKALGSSEVYVSLLLATVPFINYGAQYTGVGWYNQWKRLDLKAFTIRPLKDQALLQSEVQQVGNDVINNRFREKSIYLTLPPTVPALLSPTVTDQSRWLLSEAGDLDKPLQKPISSFYGTVKSYLPGQYGRLASINYLETAKGSIDLLEDQAIAVYGGDTFINRFSFKRKHSYFTQDRFGLPPNSDVNYSLLPNAGYPSYFFNKDNTVLNQTTATGVTDAIFSTIQLTNQGPNLRLDKDQSAFLYNKGYMYLYSYGIPYFFCESSINLDVRQATDLQENGYYPLVDPQTWTQKETVDPQKDNTYLYDRAYSHALRENKLLAYPDSQLYNQLVDKVHPNRVIYSEPGNYRYFRALNSYDFTREHGLLTGLDGLEADRVLARFENGSSLFNAYSQINTGTEVAQIGNGGLFATRPQQFAQADGGLLGSQHRAFCQTPYGYCWVDQKRGGVYLLPPGGSPEPLHNGVMEHWLLSNLPSRLLHSFPDLPANRFPIRLVYDTNTHRIILTKRDYYLKKEGLVYSPDRDVFLQSSTGMVIPQGHPDWFGPCHWTAAYHPASKQWSFQPYTPDYLLAWPKGFMSVLNSPVVSRPGSGWIHRNSRVQFQRFFGRLYPFELTVWTGNLGQNVALESIQYSQETRRYHQQDSYVTVNGLTYTDLSVNTDRQTTGVIKLFPGNMYDMREMLVNSPRLYQQPGGNWSVNQFRDQTRKNNTLPIWINDRSNTRKYINQQALRTAEDITIHSPVSGTGFLIHFSQHTTDKYQYIHQWVKPSLKALSRP